MADFFIIVGFVFWAIAVLAAAGGAMTAFAEEFFLGGFVALIAAVLAGVGFFFAANATWHWFDGPQPPADGCYMVRHDTGLVPVSTGKTTTVIPYDDVKWYPIECPN